MSFVHASTDPEPFGLVIAEGMACARAVVVSRAGGAAEITSPGVDALAYAPGDAVQLGECLLSLVTNAALDSRPSATRAAPPPSASFPTARPAGHRT
jgi:glycosyltransferase involved in cell wall biosynthesis